MDNKVISLDYHGKRVINAKHWQFAVGSGHAHLAHRFDYIEQLKYCVSELGFKSVRFHGLFNDDMNVVTRIGDVVGNKRKNSPREYNFYQIAVIFDRLLEIGVKPFVELSFMPTALAKGKKTIFHYKGNVTLPKYMGEWTRLMREFGDYLIDRYGIDEVASWNFEVWNEPNLGCFFAGNQADYFNLYRETCLALKAVDNRIRVGGPSTANNEWIDDFVGYCEATATPLDFVSTHQYPSDALGHDINNKNLRSLYLDCSRGIVDDIHLPVQDAFYNENCFGSWQRGEMTRQCRGVRKSVVGKPLYYTE